jgi:glycolate oxidase FAD binding subunit
VRITSNTLLKPNSIEELAAELAAAASRKERIHLGGNFSKTKMAGPVEESGVTISTASLNRVIQYEPRDLTISVEAGIRYSEVTRVLAEHGQMIPLDPPFASDSTIGGIVAANLSGPRRRLYGTARDMVIGMTFATLEGKLIRTGGMVVKNVAGLDMGKLMIGSFGTLAAIAVVNFRLHPAPVATRTFARSFGVIPDLLKARDAVLRSVLQPMAIDIVKQDGFQLLVQAGGSAAVLDRYERDLAGYEVLRGDVEKSEWESIRETTPRFLIEHPDGAVVRISCTLPDVLHVLAKLPSKGLARAGSGVVYGYFEKARDALGKGVIEFAPQNFRKENELWPSPGTDFAMMEKVKAMFDPDRLLNRGRLYGRI